MPELTATVLRKQIATGRLDPLYALVGDDDAAKARVVAAISETIEEGLRGFNVERIYVRDTPPDQSKAGRIVDAARTLPMMAPRRIVIVPDAERLVGKEEEEEEAAANASPPPRAGRAARAARVAASSDNDVLEAYFRAPCPETALIFVLPANKTTLGRRPLKTLMAKASVVVLERKGEPDETRELIDALVRRAGMTIDAAAIRLLADRAAGDRSRARIEAERACLYAATRGRVTVADVQAIIGPPTVTDTWALVRQLEKGSAAGALRELDLLLAENGIPYMILGQIRSFVENKRFTRAAVDALLKADLDLKTSAADPRVLLERLIVELVG